PRITITFVIDAPAPYGSTVWLTAFLQKAVLATHHDHLRDRDVKNGDPWEEGPPSLRHHAFSQGGGTPNP
ncbi:MAG: hypothetical protein AAFY75_17090, partial [Pseudomonadota bacterium]